MPDNAWFIAKMQKNADRNRCAFCGMPLSVPPTAGLRYRVQQANKLCTRCEDKPKHTKSEQEWLKTHPLPDEPETNPETGAPF